MHMHNIMDIMLEIVNQHDSLWGGARVESVAQDSVM